jgi:type II secretory pathway predicted ATPase ExeA
MIEAFYNLKTLPFQKDIKADDIFQSSATRELFERLEYMKNKRGIMLLTGLPGTGKTLHLRAFVDRLNPNLFKSFYLPLSTINTTEFYRQLAVCLGGEPCWGKSQLFQSIQNSIKHYVLNNKKVPVIIFDESHMMKSDNFHELQIITNFNMDSEDPVILILAAQPHLREKLSSPVHQSFNQRITLKFNITPLSEKETHEYIMHQMKLAGRKEILFNESAIATIHKNSGGTPRVINKLALKCMTLGAIEKKETLTEEEVYCASKEL